MHKFVVAVSFYVSRDKTRVAAATGEIISTTTTTITTSKAKHVNDISGAFLHTVTPSLFPSHSLSLSPAAPLLTVAEFPLVGRASFTTFLYPTLNVAHIDLLNCLGS